VGGESARLPNRHCPGERDRTIQVVCGDKDAASAGNTRFIGEEESPAEVLAKSWERGTEVNQTSQSKDPGKPGRSDHLRKKGGEAYKE